MQSYNISNKKVADWRASKNRHRKSRFFPLCSVSEIHNNIMYDIP